MNNNEIKSKISEGTLDQYSALTHMAFDMLEIEKKRCKMFFIALIISIIVNLITVGAFLCYESQWEYSDTITTTQEVSGEDSDINNVEGDQYKDSAKHIINEGGED